MVGKKDTYVFFKGKVGKIYVFFLRGYVLLSCLK